MEKNTSTTQTTGLSARKGVVVSVSGTKTVVVRVDTLKAHAKYLKRYMASKKYHVHDEAETAKVGDTVFFAECRPMSKQKKYQIVKG